MSTHERQFGKPLGEEIRSGSWSLRHYESGSVFSHPQHGTREISDPIRSYWMKGLVEKLGFPIADLEQVDVLGRRMRRMHFERGLIYWDEPANLLFDVTSPDPDIIAKVLAAILFGKWDTPFEEGVVGVHAALLHTNEVLFWTYEDTAEPHEHHGVVPHGEWSLLSLANGTQPVKKQHTERNQFCAGQSILGTGKVLVVGGDRHSLVNDKSVRLYNPETRSWKDLPDLDVGRWYPTVVTVGEKYALALAGDDAPEWAPPNDYHVPNPTVQYAYESGGTTAPHNFDAALIPPSVYPFAFVLPGGKLFVHMAAKTRITGFAPMNFDTAEKLTAVDPGSRTYPLEGTAVLLPLRPTDSPPYRARIMVIGGGNLPENISTPAKKTCEILDFGETNKKWKSVAPMSYARVMPDSILLPDGKVLVVNGSEAGKADLADKPVYAAELYDPATNTWTTLAEMKMPRLYHSTALLLPDGRVLTAGSDREWNQAPYDIAHTLPEVFSPPYLFKGTRPVLQLAPKEASYGKTFEAATDDAESVKSVALIRNGSCTHSFNSDQRYVELTIKNRLSARLWIRWKTLSFWIIKIPWPEFFVAKGLQLQAPPDSLVAPPGYYMLFLLSASDVPSEAKFVRLR